MKTYALIISMLVSLCTFAQSDRVLRGNRDISSNLINHIVQDRDGRVWISTDNGLNCHDGVKTQIFYSEQDHNSNFSSVFIDSKDRHFACSAEHIMLFDKDKAKLVTIPAYRDNGKELLFRAYGVTEVDGGKIVAYSAGFGVLQLEESNGKMCFRTCHDLIPQMHIRCIMQDKRKRIWATTEDGLVCKENNRIHIVKSAEPVMASSLSSIEEDEDGNIWCGSIAEGLWKVDAKTYTMRQVSAFRDLSVTCILSKIKDYMIVGTNGLGVFEMHIPTETVKPFPFYIGNLQGSRTNVHALYNDNRNNLWIGCYQKGVVILPHQENRFPYIGYNSSRDDIIGNSCVQAVTVDNQGTLWVAGDGDGLYAIDHVKSSQRTSTHYAPSATIPKTAMAFYPDSRGNLWIGTWLQGLYVMNTATRECRKVTLPVADQYANVFSFVEDSYGHLWIATSGNGLFYMDQATGQIHKVKSADGKHDVSDTANMLHNRWINHLFMGQNGILYIATTDGVSAIDVNTHSFLRAFKGKNHIFGGQNINNVCQTKNGMIYAGSSKGLICYNPKNGNIKTFGYEEGFAEQTVMSIVDDHKGSLWISTNMGITRLELVTGKFFNYRSSSGMFANEFSRSAAYLAKDGTIYMGGTEGVNYFHPKNVVSVAERPFVMFSGLYVGGKLVNTDSRSNGRRILDTDIMSAQEIILDYVDDSFSIELSSLDFVRTQSVQYEYRLDNSKWEPLAASQNIISFNNLTSGKHVLEVRAKGPSEYGEVRRLIIHIMPPWYNTWWAWLMYFFIAVASLRIYHYMQQRSRKAFETELNLRHLEEISEAKMQFFINIAHEIRTPMTLIVSPLQRLLQSDNDPRRRSSYLLMNRNAQRIMQLVTQLLDVRKIEKGQMQLSFREMNVVEFLENATLEFSDLFDTKNISVRFSSDEEAINAYIDPLNFDKIIANLLSNAFKYTPRDGHVLVQCGLADADHWTVRVEDDGRGIPEEELDRIFERFYQYACDANNVVNGSGVGLNLTRSLVQLHHGTITASNNKGRPGCCFLLQFPLGRAHLQDSELLQASPEAQAQPLLHTGTAVPVPSASSDALASSLSQADGAAELLPMTDNKRLMGAKKRLLVVEDDEEIQHYLMVEMASAFNVTCVNNGKEALDNIRRRLPDIIISDVMMPEMDGIEMLRTIRRNTTMNNIPVILLSAKASEHDNIEGLDTGADAYVTKPFNIEILRRMALNLVQRQQQLRNIYDGRQTPKVDKVKVLSPDERLMQRIMKVINDNLSNPKLGNEIITQEVGISRVHLYRKLKEMTNLSLRDFIKNIRLTEAARLLSENRHSIAEVAEKTGFENVSYFTVVFKQKYGVPPSVYMNKE